MSTSTVKFRGIPQPFARRMLIVPGLSIKQLRDNQQLVAECLALEKEAAGPTSETDVLFKMLGPVAKLIHLALSRNYEDVTLDEVEEVIDTYSMREYVSVVMGQSGMVRVAAVPAEEPPVGEAQRSSQ